MLGAGFKGSVGVDARVVVPASIPAVEQIEAQAVIHDFDALANGEHPRFPSSSVLLRPARQGQIAKQFASALTEHLESVDPQPGPGNGAQGPREVQATARALLFLISTQGGCTRYRQFAQRIAIVTVLIAQGSIEMDAKRPSQMLFGCPFGAMKRAPHPKPTLVRWLVVCAGQALVGVPELTGPVEAAYGAEGSREPGEERFAEDISVGPMLPAVISCVVLGSVVIEVEEIALGSKARGAQDITVLLE